MKFVQTFSSRKFTRHPNVPEMARMQHSELLKMRVVAKCNAHHNFENLTFLRSRPYEKIFSPKFRSKRAKKPNWTRRVREKKLKTIWRKVCPLPRIFRRLSATVVPKFIRERCPSRPMAVTRTARPLANSTATKRRSMTRERGGRRIPSPPSAPARSTYPSFFIDSGLTIMAELAPETEAAFYARQVCPFCIGERPFWQIVF